MLETGAVIGIIGGGQLASMLCDAAKKLGYRTCVWSDKKDSPAFDVADFCIKGDYSARDKKEEFCQKIDAVTLEFENIDFTILQGSSLNWLNLQKALRVSQGRYLEKSFFKNELNAQTADYHFFDSIGSDFVEVAAQVHYNAILKTNSFGYDGKGQYNISCREDAENIFAMSLKGAYILEKKVQFNRELSIIVARDDYNNVVFYPLVENIHKNGILDKTIFPAKNINAQLQNKAEEIAKKTVEKLDYIGVLAIEFFQVGDELIVNEFAPRPHNSAHYTIDACSVSQFENAILAASGNKVITPVLEKCGEMVNLIGEDIALASELGGENDVIVHNYRKEEIKEGRKMGHYTRLCSLKN